MKVSKINIAIPCIHLNLDVFEGTLIPIFVLSSVVMQEFLTLTEIAITFSYLKLGMSLVAFILMTALIIRQKSLNRFDLIPIVFSTVLLTVTVLNGSDIKNVIYETTTVLTTIFAISYYHERKKMLLCALCAVCSACIYLNFAYMVANPELWLTSTGKSINGYLLGNNYNQFGCRIVLSLTVASTTIMYSWRWKINFMLLSILSVATLFMVQSMTSITVVMLFFVFIIVRRKTFQWLEIWLLIITFLLFQVFVVFNGKNLENNELAAWFIEGILDKDITFTYRTNLWSRAMRVFFHSPILGYGLVDSNWYITNLSCFAVGPHNMVLAQMIHGGVILLALYTFLSVLVIYHAMRNWNKMLYRIVFGFICIKFVGLMEMFPDWFILMPAILLYYMTKSKENFERSETKTL